MMTTQNLEDLSGSILADPVIGIHHLEVTSCGIAQSRVDGLAMPAVLLMHHTDETGVTSLPIVCFPSRVILGRPIIDDDDLDLPRHRGRKQRRDAMVHVRR